jgi:hypothetical protein
VVLQNLNFIKEQGIKKFIIRQKNRIKLLEKMIENFDDGRSRSFFCRATCLLDIRDLENSLNKAIRKIKTENIKTDDLKTKAKILRANIEEITLKKGVELFKKTK